MYTTDLQCSCHSLRILRGEETPYSSALHDRKTLVRRIQKYYITLSSCKISCSRHFFYKQGTQFLLIYSDRLQINYLLITLVLFLHTIFDLLYCH